MKLPSHVLTKLCLAGVVGTIGAVVLCEPADRIRCQPIVQTVEEDSTPLAEIVRTTTNDPLPMMVAPSPQPQPQVTPKPKPAHFHASACGPCGQG